MPTPRYYGTPRGMTVTTGTNGLVAVTWPRTFLAPPVVSLTVENESTTLGAYADVLKGSVTVNGCTIRSWRAQLLNTLLISAGANPVMPYPGAVVHVVPHGDLA